MKKDLYIKEHNIPAHIDIANDIKDKKNGLFTFNLMVSQGNIESYATYETITGERVTTTVLSAVSESQTTRTY